MASWALVCKQTKLKRPHIVNLPNHHIDTPILTRVKTYVNQFLLPCLVQNSSKVRAISHSATFTPFSALIQSSASHGSAQQGLNGRKHFFRRKSRVVGLGSTAITGGAPAQVILHTGAASPQRTKHISQKSIKS